MYRIGIFGDGLWAANFLRDICDDNFFEIVFVALRNKTSDTTLKKIAIENNLPIMKFDSINARINENTFTKMNLDLFVSISYDQIFKKNIYSIPKNGTINCHTSLLPFYRGRNPLNWALINNEKKFGITAHFIDDGIDTGDIIYQKSYPIKKTDNYSNLLNLAHIECANVTLIAINMIAKNKFKRIPQSTIHKQGSYCSRRVPGDEIINWSQNSLDIFNFVRALDFPGPIATTYLNKQEVKIKKVALIKDAVKFVGVPGSIIYCDAGFYVIKTLDTSIKLIEFESKEKLKVGYRFI
jgi:methionyl-tRNA formyltransferase